MADGIDVGAVTAWFADHVPGAAPPLEFGLISGGHSNLTFAVTDAGGRRMILRRPPLGHVLATAHDVGREHRIIAALGPTPVPVPAAIGFCDDLSVNGAPFYVMEFVEGTVIRDVEAGRAVLDESARSRVAGSLIDVLAAIHAVDPDEIGLGELGRKDGYIARQLRRWHGQWTDSQATTTSGAADVPDIDEVHARLAASIPEQGPAAIVHGDYRIDNCMTGPDARIAAVLDWELCTLGDPLADLGMLLICWTRPGDEFVARPDSPTQLPGFPDRDEVLAHYQRASGRQVPERAVAYYQAFAFWKLACINAGVYARYVAGVMGRQPTTDLADMADGAERLARSARLILDASGAA